MIDNAKFDLIYEDIYKLEISVSYHEDQILITLV